MDILYKLRRIARWGKRIGLLNALSFELQQTLRRPVIAFRHKGLNRTIYLRSSSSDISIFEHVFIEDEFDIDLDAPRLILDGGANCGLAALYLASRYPTAQIIAVEPSAENCALCARNVSGLNVEIVQSAIWSASTRLKIKNPADEPWAFQCVEADRTDPDGFEARDIPSLLAGRRCDLVKLDIEGAETEVFRTPDWVRNVAAMVIEVHGEDADRRIRAACDGWTITRTGEKMLLAR